MKTQICPNRERETIVWTRDGVDLPASSRSAEQAPARHAPGGREDHGILGIALSTDRDCDRADPEPCCR